MGKILFGAKGDDVCAFVGLSKLIFVLQRVSPLRRRQGGFAVAPLTPSQCTPMLIELYRKFLVSVPFVPLSSNIAPAILQKSRFKILNFVV